jgi:ATP-dependent RNA helicase RhlE
VPDAYVHRIGRTARAGRAGEAMSFCTPEDVDLLVQIEKLMKIEIPTASGERPNAVNRPSTRNQRGKSAGKASGGRRGNGGNGGGQKFGAPKANHGAPGGANGQAKRRRPRRTNAA